MRDYDSILTLQLDRYRAMLDALKAGTYRFEDVTPPGFVDSEQCKTLVREQIELLARDIAMLEQMIGIEARPIAA